MAKAVKSKGAKSASKKLKQISKTKKKVISLAGNEPKKERKQEKIPAQGAAKSPSLVSPPVKSAKKEISQNLVEAIEKRKQAKETGTPHTGSKFFVKPPGRRGRRPKNLVDYQPENREEDTYVVEAEKENIEYDIGIRVSEKRDESGFGMDRFEDFDEELNFDW